MDASGDYRIDYENLDVEELMGQVRARAREIAGGDPRLPAADEAAAARRVAEYLVLDDARPYEIQAGLGLGGAWNVSPEDLRTSHPGAAGALIGSIRRLLRPVTKLLANLDLPLYKQFKVNLGLAAAVRDLLDENAALRAEVARLGRRVDRLEQAGDETGN